MLTQQKSTRKSGKTPKPLGPLFNSADTVGRECSIRLPNKTKGFYRERKKDSYKTRRQGLSLLGSNEITPNVFVRATILNEYV